MLGIFGLNKIATYAISATLFVGVVTTSYYVWKRNIEHAALLEFNRQQMEQTAKDQAEFIRKQQELVEKQRQSTADLIARNRQLSDRIETVNSMLNSAETQRSDRPASSILRKTIEQLERGKAQ
jgi:hypothetical protein